MHSGEAGRRRRPAGLGIRHRHPGLGAGRYDLTAMPVIACPTTVIRV
ncbi:MAG: hypothetical protein ACR2MZ_14415 [Candidatus Dormibacter sp.]